MACTLVRTRQSQGDETKIEFWLAGQAGAKWPRLEHNFPVKRPIGFARAWAARPRRVASHDGRALDGPGVRRRPGQVLRVPLRQAAVDLAASLG